jgi:hypothetical protein
MNMSGGAAVTALGNTQALPAEAAGIINKYPQQGSLMLACHT